MPLKRFLPRPPISSTSRSPRRSWPSRSATASNPTAWPDRPPCAPSPSPPPRTTRDGRLALRQRPGPNNALGRIKFLFPNRFNVYLHDTPSRSLFGRTVRTFSHGCIRVEKPQELAEWVLGPDWTPEAIEDAVEAGKERAVDLAQPIPVHIVYWTAWVDAEGILQVRNDVYGRDEPPDQALGE
jgi:murein L,D-transpeptidase YcbB/YkuD